MHTSAVTLGVAAMTMLIGCAAGTTAPAPLVATDGCPTIAAGKREEAGASYLSCDAEVWVDFPAGKPPIVDGVKSFSVAGATHRMRILTRRGAEGHASLAWADVPHEVIETKGAAQFLEDVGRGAFGEHALRAERAINVGGAPARSYTYTRADNTTERALVILRKDRLYYVTFSVPPADNIDKPAARAFLGSIRFVHCKD